MDYNYLISAITGYLFGCFQASYFVGILVNKIDMNTLKRVVHPRLDV